MRSLVTQERGTSARTEKLRTFIKPKNPHLKRLSLRRRTVVHAKHDRVLALELSRCSFRS